MKKYSSRYNENSERVELDELKTELLSELSENSVQNLAVTLPSDLLQGIESVTQNFEQRWSAPPSPNVKQCKVQKLKANFEVPNTIMAEQSKKDSAAKRNSQAGIRGWVNRYISQLQTHKDAETLEVDHFKMLNNKILDSLDRIVNLEIEIEIIYANQGQQIAYKPIGESIETFINETQLKLSQFAAYVTAASVRPGDERVTNDQLLKAMSQMGNNSIKVSIDCPTFSGDENDRLEFKTWLSQFESVIKTRPNWTEEFKVTFLKSKVIKNAHNFIAHLEPVVGSYDACVKALKEQYLDEPFIIDEYFRKL